MKTFSVYLLSFLTVFGVFFAFNGIVAFNSSLILACLAYCFISYQVTESIPKPIPLNEKFEDEYGLADLEPELNHPNLDIRFHYRTIKYDINLLALYLCITFFPFYLFFLVFNKYKFGQIGTNFFINNQLISKYYKNKKVLLKKYSVVEDNKTYEVSLFSDGREEYRYNEKLHRENGAAIHYDYDLLGILNHLDKSKYYIEGKEVLQKDLNKEIKRYKMQNF